MVPRFGSLTVVALTLGCASSAAIPVADRSNNENSISLTSVWQSTPLLSPTLQSNKDKLRPAGFIKNAANATTRSISSTVNGVKDAFAIHARVVSPDDPIKLSTKIGEVGPEVFISAARLFEQKGEFDRALAQYQRALQTDPHHRLALIGYARLQHREGRLEEAVRAYLRLLNQSPDDCLALNDLALCYARQRRVDDAVEKLAHAVELNPGSMRYRNNIAAVLVEAERHDEALKQLLQVHAPAEAHYNLGYILKRLGNRQDAEVHFAQALQLDPSLNAARTMLAEFSRAEDDDSRQAMQQDTVPYTQSVRTTSLKNYTTTDRTSERAPYHRRTDTSNGPVVPATSRAPRPNSAPEFLADKDQIIGPFGYMPERKLQIPPEPRQHVDSSPRRGVAPGPQGYAQGDHRGFNYRGVPTHLPPVN